MHKTTCNLVKLISDHFLQIQTIITAIYKLFYKRYEHNILCKPLLKGNAQYSRPPDTNKFRTAAF
jgi:hypothetical protein